MCIVFVSECDFCGQLLFITPSVVFVNLYQITVVHIVYCVIVLIDVIGFKLKRVIMCIVDGYSVHALSCWSLVLAVKLRTCIEISNMHASVIQ